MELSEQVNTIERALGERMLNHALVLLRRWAVELPNVDYRSRIDQLQTNYQQLFSYYLSTDDPERDDLLDRMTTECYRLVDAMYADLRLKRGLSPVMHGFNGDNPQSVLQYFSSCVHLQPSDYEWLYALVNDSSRSALGLMALAALAQNLRECFSEESMLLLIRSIQAENAVVSDQALASSILLLAHYDVRIDFFPHLQEAFREEVGDGERAFETLCALIRSTKMSIRDMLSSGELTPDNMPEPLRDMLELSGSDNPMEEIASWMPSSENEYMAGIVDMLPDTWVYEQLHDMRDDRLRVLQLVYLSVGKMDQLWQAPERAEAWLVQRLRSDKATAADYINYGHCCLLRGDRMMAYESYREARSMCTNTKAFLALFRPDRGRLVEQGVPMEQIYLIEDQLL